MSDSGYRGFIRGIKGSTKEHLTDLEFKIKKETEKLEKITDDRFATLSLNYEREQKDLKEKISHIANTIDKTKQQELDLTTFIDKVKKYTEIKELTPEIVNELIDKIYVYQQTKLNGKKYQQIDIYYAGVGIIGIPLTEYELENAFQQSIKNAKTA